MTTVRVRRRPPTFVAIDFETANHRPDSACAVALVRVEDFAIVRRESRLIRPPSPDFAYTHIHGITWSTVADQPTFAELWPELSPMLSGAKFLVAHNATFDRQVLEACCRSARLRAPRLPFRCTLQVARHQLGIWPSSLSNVCARLGIPLRHHDPASDAEACARILLHAWGVDR